MLSLQLQSAVHFSGCHETDHLELTESRSQRDLTERKQMYASKRAPESRGLNERQQVDHSQRKSIMDRVWNDTNIKLQMAVEMWRKTQGERRSTVFHAWLIKRDDRDLHSLMRSVWESWCEYVIKTLQAINAKLMYVHVRILSRGCGHIKQHTCMRTSSGI